MIDLKDYYEKKSKGLTSLVVSDDGTLVIFKKSFNQETGEPLPLETFATTTEEELDAQKAELQKQIALIDQFKQENLN